MFSKKNLEFGKKKIHIACHNFFIMLTIHPILAVIIVYLITSNLTVSNSHIYFYLEQVDQMWIRYFMNCCHLVPKDFFVSWTCNHTNQIYNINKMNTLPTPYFNKRNNHCCADTSYHSFKSYPKGLGESGVRRTIGFQ